MALSLNSRALFDACALAIIRRNTGQDLNLYPLSSDPVSMSDEAVQYLASAVQVRSNRTLTIRRADRALFADGVRGVNLYLVVCDYSTPPGEVTELSDEMRLISLGPYSNGFEVDAKRASPEAVQQYRDRAAEHNRRQEERKLAEADMQSFLSGLAERVIGYVSSIDQDHARELRSHSSVTLEDLACACRKHGVTFQQFLT